MWLRRRNSDIRQSSTRPPELQGAPVRPRWKTYAADTGYTYQYVYLGWRNLPENAAAEYVFNVCRDRSAQFHSKVRLRQAELSACEASMGRLLSAAERYAIAKMSLFSAFDSVSDLDNAAALLSPNRDDILQYLRTLDRL